MNKIPSPEEMRNATLSPGTKEYLVAYKKAQEACDIVLDCVKKEQGDHVDEMTEADEECKGRCLAFEIDGDSMEPEYNKGDIVICEEIPRDDWRSRLPFKDWDFVIAHSVEGIMLKEITSHNIETGEIICHSLNSELHPDFTLNLREVSFLYNVVEHRRSGKNTRARR